MYKYLCIRRGWELPHGYSWKELFMERYKKTLQPPEIMHHIQVVLSWNEEDIKQAHQVCQISPVSASTPIGRIGGRKLKAFLVYTGMNGVTYTPNLHLKYREGIILLDVQFPSTFVGRHHLHQPSGSVKVEMKTLRP